MSSQEEDEYENAASGMEEGISEDSENEEAVDQGKIQGEGEGRKTPAWETRLAREERKALAQMREEPGADLDALRDPVRVAQILEAKRQADDCAQKAAEDTRRKREEERERINAEMKAMYGAKREERCKKS